MPEGEKRPYRSMPQRSSEVYRISLASGNRRVFSVDMNQSPGYLTGEGEKGYAWNTA